MTTVPLTPSVVNDIVDNADERELWIVSKEFERPPYWFAEEGLNARLIKALRVVQEDRITPNSDGSYTVEGSAHRQYRVDNACSCPQSQQGKSKWCYHAVAVALYVEWQRRLHPPVPEAYGATLARRALGPLPAVPDPDDDADTLGNGSPVDDETLPLPLPPVSVDERLAAVPAPLRPQEAPMPADDSAYIPEPDHVSTAVVEAPNGVSHETPLATPLTTALVQWSAQRQVVKEFLRRELHEGTDFYTLTLRGKTTKPSLSKAGAEKFLGLLQLQAAFLPDLGTWEMLGKPTDQVLYVCQLRTRSGEIVGEGRGARSVKQDGGDLNKAIKMSEKSSLIDAVLRTGALSEVFTQDAEDLQGPDPTPVPPARPSSSDLRQRIWALVKAADATITTREACTAYVQRVTGLDLEPNNYRAILSALEGS